MKMTLVFLALVFVTSSKAQVFDPLDCNIIKKAVFKKDKIKICGKLLDVEVADMDWSRQVGLMCRDSLPENQGMIFIFPDERPLSFWMKNTSIPLSIGFFDKNKTLLNTYDMKPLETKSYASKKDAMYAVETNQGWLKKNKIKNGCKFEFVPQSP